MRPAYFRTCSTSRTRCGVLALALTLVASLSSAQTRASVELEGKGLQVHPATYTWEGDIEPVLDPGANFYTFYYTGTVLPDGTVDEDVEIERVAVSNLEWEQNRAAIVSEIQSVIEGGQASASKNKPKKTLVNRDVELDGNFEYVDKSKNKPKAAADPAATSDPISQAEWTFYYDQVVLWQYYVQRVILSEDPDGVPNKSQEERDRQEYIDAINAYEGDLRGIRRSDIFNELAAEIPDNKFSARTYFRAKRDAEDQSMIEALHDEFVRRASLREDRARRIFDEMIEAIEARRTDRQLYADWRREKGDSLDDFVTAWTQVKDGELLNFGQTYYLLTEEPIEAVPADARSVPIRARVTPQDLIEENGSLKPAQYRPGY